MEHPEIHAGVKVHIPSTKTATLTSIEHLQAELNGDGYLGDYLMVHRRKGKRVVLEYPEEFLATVGGLASCLFDINDVILYQEPQRNPNTRTIAAAVAKAIIALDKVSFLRGEDPLSRKTAAARQDLMQALTEAGYELPDPDSSRLRRIQPGQ